MCTADLRTGWHSSFLIMRSNRDSQQKKRRHILNLKPVLAHCQTRVQSLWGKSSTEGEESQKKKKKGKLWPCASEELSRGQHENTRPNWKNVSCLSEGREVALDWALQTGQLHTFRTTCTHSCGRGYRSNDSINVMLILFTFLVKRKITRSFTTCSLWKYSLWLMIIHFLYQLIYWLVFTGIISSSGLKMWFWKLWKMCIKTGPISVRIQQTNQNISKSNVRLKTVPIHTCPSITADHLLINHINLASSHGKKSISI